MPKKRNSNNNPRGRGTGGSPRGRGRGRGRGSHSNAPQFRGIGRAFPDFYDDDFDFPVQIWSNEQSHTASPGSGPTRGGAGQGRGAGRGRGRGRGQGQAQIPDQSSRGTGRGGYMASSSPTPARGRSRGRGNPQTPQRSGPRFGRDAPLSKLLYEDRPYLRPIFFVKSQHTLFQQEEELLQPVNEEIGNNEASHVPTADRVARVFGVSSADIQAEEKSSSEDGEDEKLEEIDFADIASFKEKVVKEAKELAAIADRKQSPMVIEETFTGFYMDATPTLPGSSTEPKVLTSRTREIAQPLGVEMDDEEVIVYVAPHPRTGRTRSSSPIKVMATQPQAQESHHDPMETQKLEDKDKDLSVQSVDSALTSIHTPTISLPPSNSIIAPILASITPVEDPSQVRPSQSSGLPTVERPTHLPHISPELPTVALDKERAPSHTTTSAKTTLEASEVPREVALAPVPLVAPEFSSISFSFASSSVVTANTTSTSARETDTPTSSQTPSRPAIPIGHRAKKAKVKQRQREARALRRKAARRGGFGSFGAIVAEAALYSGDEDGGKDPHWEERRRGDSDVDWEDEDEEGGLAKIEGEENVDVDGLSTGLEGMDIDPDVGSMRGFLESMRANQGRHVTMDDIADEARMRKEDEEEDNGSGSSSDEDDDELGEDINVVLAINQAERMEIGEFSDDGEDNVEDSESDDDEDEDDDGDIDLTPNASFEVRLARLREQSRKGGSSKKRQPAAHPLDDDDDDDDEGFPSWAETDDDFYDQIQSILDAEIENIGVMNSRQQRKERNRLFRAVQDGAFDDIEDIGLDMFPQARRRKDKGKHLPADLAAQWERDRQKKAERKRQRRLDQLAEAADPLTQKKGGKKGRKAMLAAADPSSIDVAGLPNRVTDLMSVEVQIRRFVDDIGGRKQEMVLPPMEKGARKVVHELALAFGLKSVSKGKGNGRYTTLIKTTRTGVGVREGKIRGIMKRSGAGGGAYDTPGNKEKGKGKAGVVPKHREGDEVGKAAPKINASNIGFRMLASMGWSEGDLIGATAGGLAAPLTAIIKNTKLGLGATR